jgi:hypothetical protein
LCVTAPYVVDPVKVIDCARIDTAPVKDDNVADVRPFVKVGAPLIEEPVMVTVWERIDTAPVKEDKVADVIP